jgi:hypothetical protein
MAGGGYIAETPLGTREITLALTAAATVVSGLIAWTVVAVLERYQDHPLAQDNFDDPLPDAEIAAWEGDSPI